MLISVVMSIYKEPVNYVREAVDSILNQTYKEIELIIVVDNPDNIEVVELINEYKEKFNNIKIHINDRNIGLAMSLNKGIGLASGELIARMDADDRSLPNRLEREYEFLVKGNYGMVSSLVDRIDEYGKVWGELKPFPNESKVIMGMLPVKNVVIHPTVLMKKSIVDELGGYRPYSSSQDHDLWLRMLTAGISIGLINEKLLEFRMHPKSVSSLKGYSQYLNEKHLKGMYKKRRRFGKDTFSESELNAFLKKYNYDDKEYVKRQNGLLQEYRFGVAEIRRKNIVRGGRMIAHAIVFSACVRDNLLITVHSKILRRKLGYEQEKLVR